MTPNEYEDESPNVLVMVIPGYFCFGAQMRSGPNYSPFSFLYCEI